MKRITFTTAQDAEHAFYEAFENRNLSAMMKVWAEDEEIVCIHPGSTRIVGYTAIKESWRKIFEDGTKMQLHLRNQQYMQGMLLSVHSVMEHILIGGETEPRPPVIATNIYLLTANGWRIVVHHASDSPEQALKAREISPHLLH
jgi:ketosteroid isomerase-like protein